MPVEEEVDRAVDRGSAAAGPKDTEGSDDGPPAKRGGKRKARPASATPEQASKPRKNNGQTGKPKVLFVYILIA